MASALENYVNHVRNFSSSDNFRELAEYLNESLELLTKNYNILDNVLETLDIQQHSLGVLYVLLAKLVNIVKSNADSGNIVKSVKDFINLCNGEQIRYAAQTYFELCHVFTSYMVTQPNVIQAIKILSTAIEKVRLHETQLTSVHADLCLVSLKAKCFNTVLRFLDVDITAIATTDDVHVDSKYFLLYYYYGGMIYTAIKNYDRALYFFEVAISTPAMVMSCIMLEAYKKFILVSLILHGKVINIPKYSHISRFMKPLSQAYYELGNAYATSSSDEVRNVINKYRDLYSRDINLGLVKQVAQSLYKKNIQRLTKTFLTLSLADVASRVQLSSAVEAEKYILNMIKSGEIFASINQKDGMVIFKDDPEKYCSPEMFLKIQEDMSRVMELNKQINKMEEDIMLNPMFVKKSIGNQDEDIMISGQHSKSSYSGDPTD
ncbi:COP9 signalosome complex subunit 3 [Condylostylus longicornis]|uniref:COP9 signalosome complex subunit 3 n=1 Tax=Condylostylus longicornis TaxID=2530218 RepID=UPI00244DE2AA|nr:COP9 signalosome complex subunit 3 [Condylostylus longicornis]